MLNPLVPYEPKFLQAFLKKGVKAFVLQTYERGRDNRPAAPPAYLLTHYHDIESAQAHFAAIANDANAQIFHVQLPCDLQELKQIGRPGADMHVFMSFKKPNYELQARLRLDKTLRSYIRSTLKWHPGPLNIINFSLELFFGEIYAVFQHGSKYHKIKLETLEKMNGYVL